jgi:serine/threonine protein kinase/TolB-like protein
MSNMEAGPRPSKPTLPSVTGEITPERWQRIKELVISAEQLDAAARGKFLRDACGSDNSLRSEVESLLEVNDAQDADGISTIGLLERTGLSLVTDPMIGRQLGAYEVVKQIGRGGMATVYLAERADDAYRKQVAVKLVHLGPDNAEIVSRFRNERRTLAALDHPNIVRLIDGGSTSEGVPYLVMDIVEGLPIDEYCDRQLLSVEQRLRLFLSVCGAVQYAHQHMVVHRDLKPSNILVTSDGVPKLLDFGIAKVLAPDSSEQAHSVTITQARRMTPAYASPEQVRGKEITPASDIYSLGVVLYELLTGRRPYPFEQVTPSELEKAICEQEPESPSTAVSRKDAKTSLACVSDTKKLRRRLQGDLDKIILTALNKEPTGRYASLDQFAADIQMHLENRPVKARGRTVGYRASKFVRRRKNELLTATFVLWVLLAAAGYTLWEHHQATTRARAELASQLSRGRRSVAVVGLKNLSSNAETAWVSTALAEMLTTDLAAGGTLRAVDDERVALAKLELSLPESDSLSKSALGALYKNLGCDYVIVGSYNANDADRGVRLNLQDAKAEETVESLSEAGSQTALADLARRAGAKLRASLGVPPISPSDLANVQASMPTNPESARLY